MNSLLWFTYWTDFLLLDFDSKVGIKKQGRKRIKINIILFPNQNSIFPL